jgi:CHAT domain-containing protein
MMQQKGSPRKAALVFLALTLLAACRTGTWRLPNAAEQFAEARLQLQRGEVAGAEKIRTALRLQAGENDPAVLLLELQQQLDRRENPNAAKQKLAALSIARDRPELEGVRLLLLARAGCAEKEPGSRFDHARRYAEANHFTQLVSESEMYRGSCALDRNALAEAEPAFQEAVRLAESNGDRFSATAAYGSLANIRIESARYDSAVALLEQSLVHARALRTARLQAITQANLALCYTRLGDYTRALSQMDAAEAVLDKPQFSRDLTRMLLNRGALLILRQEYGEAHRYLERALQLLRQSKQDAEDLPELLANLALVSLEEGNLEAAERYHQESLQRKRELKRDAESIQNSDLTGAEILRARGQNDAAAAAYDALLQSASDASLKWEAHAGLAVLAMRRQRPDEAARNFRAAISVIEASRDTLQKEESRVSFVASLIRFYRDYVNFLVDTGRPEEALRVVESSRMQGSRRFFPQAQLQAGTDAFVAEARRRQSVMLSFWVAPDRSHLWAVSGRGIRHFILPGESEIARRVEWHQRAIQRNRDLLVESEATQLYQALLGRLEAESLLGAKVVLTADGPLHQLNFETLVRPGPIAHYWLETTQIEVTPALTVLLRRSAATLAKDNGILLFGAPLAVEKDFPELPHAAKELDAIGALFSPAQRRVMEGKAATPAAWRDADPGRYRFLHFAAHSQPNTMDPLDSAIILSPDAAGHRLFARELSAVKLPVELVTISACRGAGARAWAGEGLVGLASAFLSSGAQRVIAGLWNVEDASTAQLMESLYRQIRLGRTPAEALREAKLGLLKSGTAYRKPYYWGPFLLYTQAQ